MHDSFINCPRYITKHGSPEPSRFVPDADGNTPLATWKRIDLLQDVIPERFQGRAEHEGGTLTIDEYERQVDEGTT